MLPEAMEPKSQTHEPTLAALEAELARLEQLQKDIQAVKKVEGFTDDRPFLEQAEERLRALKQQ